MSPWAVERLMREAAMPFGPSNPPGRRLGSLRSLVLAGGAALALVVAPLGGGPTQAAEKNITRQVQKETPIAMPSLAPLVDRVLPAVVNISVQLNNEAAAQSDQSADEGSDQNDQPSTPFDQFLRKFFQNNGTPQLHREVMALGSGFIVDPSGYVVTNNHVVGHSNKVSVILQDNSRHPAKIIGRDDKTDLALLKIDSKKRLPFVSWGDSDQAKVGDWVVAVGNPFGLGGSVTAGIISALGRNINEGPYDDFIQIDAPINRGNSGGPTFNLSGEVIGINTAIYSPSGGSVGIGFAVPSNTAKNVITQLKENGHVTRGWLGVAIQSITPAIARGLGINPEQPEGALVASVTPDSPAAKAGLKQGDVILKAGDHPVKQVHDLPRVVAASPIGQKLALTVERDGKQITVEPTIAEMPQNLQQMASDTGQPETPTTSLGMQLASITPERRSQFHIPKDVEGVVVTHVASDSPAGALGVEEGDVIMAIDQQPAANPERAAAELKQAAAKGTILLLLNRHGVTQFVGLSTTPGVGSGSGAPPGGLRSPPD
jgi:serine protease Do